jgi:hypothetical protein
MARQLRSRLPESDPEELLRLLMGPAGDDEIQIQIQTQPNPATARARGMMQEGRWLEASRQLSACLAGNAATEPGQI